jgi:DNA polymerase III epsilon subunit-like protein
MEVVSLDLESTGLSTFRDRIVEFALIKQKADGSRERLSSLVNPTIPIPVFVQGIHGITDEMVRDCKTFRELAPQFLEFLGTTSTLCGHNLIRFDLPLLQAELARAGFKPIDLSKRSVVDSLVIFRKMEPHTLAKAVEFYVPHKKLINAHRAEADAEAALDVWLAQKQCYATQIGATDKLAASFCIAPSSFNKVPSKPGSAGDSKRNVHIPEVARVISASATPHAKLSLPAAAAAVTMASADDKTIVNEGKETKMMDDILSFGKHQGKRLNQIAIKDAPYLRWLARTTPSFRSAVNSAFATLTAPSHESPQKLAS